MRHILASRLTCLLLISGLLGTAASSQTATPEPAPAGLMTDPASGDQAAIAAILEAQDRAWAAGDPAAYTARALPAISFTNVVGAYSLGKPLLVKQVQYIFSTIYKGSHLKSQVVHISMIGPDVALVDCTTELRDFVRPPLDAAVVDGAVHTRLQEVMVRHQGEWWIASLHNVLVDPAFLPGAPARK